MLLDLREYVRGSKPVKYTLITIISIPFVFFGVNTYFSGGGSSYAAKVDGVEVSLRDFEQAYFQQRSQLQQMFGGQIPEGFGDEAMIRRQALDSLLTQQALRNVVADNNLAVSDQTLANAIQDIPIFQRDGAFDADMYRRELQSRSMSPAQFEAGFREDAAIGQFRSGIVDTAFTLPDESKRAQALTEQVRVTDYLRLEIAAVRDGTEVAEEEISAHFEENSSDYMFPQRVKVEYLELDHATLKDAVAVTDEEIAEYFNENRGNYIAPEERAASHILLEKEDGAEAAIAQLNDIKSRIESGEEFADLAREFSTDVGSAENGGSLGQFGKGVMVPEFEQAVYALQEPGQISEPVESEFGVHLIRLDEIIPERGKTLEEVSDDVAEILKTDIADEEYLELYDQLTELTFDNPDSLEAAADATGLEIQQSDWVDGTGGEEGVLANPQVLAAALSESVMADANNSDVFEVGEKHVLSLRLLEHQDPRPKTLEDVREEITEQLRTEKAGSTLDEKIEAITAAFEGGSGLDTLAEEHGGTVYFDKELNRRSAELDRSAIQSLFKLPKPADAGTVTESFVLANGDRAFAVVKAVLDGPTDTDDAAETKSAEQSESTEEPAGTANPQLGNAEFSLLLQNLRENATVETNPQVLETAEES